MPELYRITRTNFSDTYDERFTELADAIAFARKKPWQVAVWQGDTLHFTHCPLYGNKCYTQAARDAMHPRKVHVIDPHGRPRFNRLLDNGSDILRFESGHGFVERDRLPAGSKVVAGWWDA